MQQALQISFRNMEGSFSLKRQIEQRTEELEQFFDRITSCRVVVEARHRHQHQGRLYHVRIDIGTPGGEIIVNRDPGAHHAHEDARVAVRDAFDAARRQLEDSARVRRGATKARSEATVGRISSIIADEGYGFLTGDDGEEIYFHRNSVPNGGFERLTIGEEVRFTVHPGEGEKGPQASTVVPVGRS